MGVLREHAIELLVAEDGRSLQGGLDVVVRDARVRARGEEPSLLAHVAAHHRAVQQRIAKGPLVIRIADRGSHVPHCALST